MTRLLKKEYQLLFFIIFIYSIECLGQNYSKLDYTQLKDIYLKNQGNKKEQNIISKAFINKAFRENDNLQIGRGYNFLYNCSEQNTIEKIKLLDSVIKYPKNDWIKEYDFPEKAYVNKANELRLQFKFNEAINNLLLAEKYCKEKESDYIYWVYYYLAIIKSEDLGETKEALKLKKKIYNFLIKNKNYKDYDTLHNYILFSLADSYKSLKITDSCKIYNNLGYKNSIYNNNPYYKNLFTLNEGANLVLQRKYKTAIDSITNALPFLIKNEDYGNTLAGYYYLGKAYQGLHNSKMAVKNFKKVDSINMLYNEIIFEFCDGYSYLIDYYKKNGDNKNQLLYATKKIEIDSVLNSNYKDLSKKIRNEFETPNLLNSKEQEVNEAYNWIYVLLFLSLCTISIILYEYKRHKIKNQIKLEELTNKFENLIKNESASNISNLSQNNDIDQEETNKKININPERLSEIISKIELFEKNQDYFDPKINATSLALKLNTNSRYLIEVIKTKKNKTVAQYINELRIENGLKKLQADRKLLKYNNEAIALEFGFNNYKTFKKAFLNITQVEFSQFTQKILNTINQ